ncbi:MAG: NDP-hexose 2,3-dehydratase family protein [Candidatus Aenigmarchaeota archaeon]|nr:NDP-hexose 2,3-dehydratase family protein [Candidatus Aenigmarchaeota archaeon]
MPRRNEGVKKSLLEAIQKLDENPNLVAMAEHFSESIFDQNQFNNLEQVRKWLEDRAKECKMRVEKINLKDAKGWSFDEKTGNLVHESGGFFSVIGVRISNSEFREAGQGWDQPMIDQGNESGIAGILMKRFNGIPHYLLEAKAEPGNYGKVQLSATLQVTFSNLKQLHKGRKPLFSEFFENPDKHKVLYAQWLPEDGGRFYMKRTYNMLVEADEDKEIEVPNGFIWVTLYQIKELLKQDNLVNPHVRSVIAHL